MFYYESAFVNC